MDQQAHKNKLRGQVVANNNHYSQRPTPSIVVNRGPNNTSFVTEAAIYPLTKQQQKNYVESADNH